MFLYCFDWQLYRFKTHINVRKYWILANVNFNSLLLLMANNSVYPCFEVKLLVYVNSFSDIVISNSIDELRSCRMKINNKLGGHGILYHFPRMQHSVTLNYLVILCILLNQLCLVVITAVVIIFVEVLLKCVKKCTAGVKHWGQKSIFQHQISWVCNERSGVNYVIISNRVQKVVDMWYLLQAFILQDVVAKDASRSFTQMHSGGSSVNQANFLVLVE